MLVLPVDARALNARVRWLPSPGAVAGYDLFVRRSGQPYGAAIDAGLPPAGAGGVLAYVVDNLADGFTYYFTVTARASDGTRTACAGELVLGNPDACVVESCCPGQACTFASARDGTPCDGTDACRLCRATACTATAVSVLDTTRLKVGTLATEPRTTVSGRFVPPDPLAPSTEGLTLTVVDGAGKAVLTTFVPPEALRADPGGTTFSLAPDYRDARLRVLRLRLRAGVATVRARLAAAPATAAGSLGWAVASGRSCGRSDALSCAPSPRGLSCR